MLESCVQNYRFRTIRCLYPLPGWHKCDTNGDSKGNIFPSFANFCINNHERDILGVKGRGLPLSTNIVAEAVTISDGIQFFIDRNLLPLIVETDSPCIINMLKENWAMSESIVKEVKAINKMRKDVLIQLKHTIREGNSLADFFATPFVNFVGTKMMENFHYLPISS